MKIHQLDARAAIDARDQLADLLLDAVGHGGALGFDPGLGRQDAERYWHGVTAALADGSRILLAATHEGTLLGTVQLALCQRPGGGHRAEVKKMMVHTRVRRRGIGSVLLRAAEAEARERQRDLLFLDTEAGSGAEQLYHDLGYTRVDAAPQHAAAAAGAQPRPSAVYTKSLLMPETA